MENHKRRLPWALVGLGAAMALCALAMLLQTRAALQYTVIPPEAGERGENIVALADSARKLGDSMKDALAWTALDGAAGVVNLSVENASVDANLIAIGEGWLEVWPRFLKDGRRLGESELSDGAEAIMLDERLAFRLFGAQMPEDAKVSLNGADYKVVGTVRHGGSLLGGRGVGDVTEYDAYIPLVAAARDGIPLSALTLSALPQGGSGASMLFLEGAKGWRDGGELIDLKKEAMRRTVLPRVLLLIVGLYVLVGLLRRMTGLCGRWYADFRQRLSMSYFKALIPRLLGLVGLALLGYGALIGAAYLLLVFSAQPLYVFTEWVPENIVEWSSIAKVFWSLTASAGRLVRVGTRELRVIEFWGGVLRWGVVLALLGLALRARGSRVKPS